MTQDPNSPDSPDSTDIQARLAAAGLSLDDLARAGLVSAGTGSPDRTVATQVRLGLELLARDQSGSHRTWSPYLRALAEGFGDLCPCPCPRSGPGCTRVGSCTTSASGTATGP